MSVLENRLNAIHKQLIAVHEGTAGMTTPALGREREDFIDIFLKNCMPAGFRFGSGQAVDSTGKTSHQLDVVIDSNFAPSIPLIGSQFNRLYLIESIASVIEVKSDLSGQWNEVVKNAQSVRGLTQEGPSGSSLPENRLRDDCIAYFTVSYKGWAKDQTLIEKWNEEESIDCILQLEPLKIIHRSDNKKTHKIINGPQALLCFLELNLNALKRNDHMFDLSVYYPEEPSDSPE